MKTVYLVRHAKAIKDFYTPDLERGLTQRGKEDIPLMAERLRELNAIPEAIFCSHAKRAKKTAVLMAEALQAKAPELQRKLYEANPLEILYVLQEMPDSLSSVMLVAHNPGLTYAVSLLSNAEIDHLPTCAVARIDFNSKNWKSLEEGRGKLAFLEYPRLVKEQQSSDDKH